MLERRNRQFEERPSRRSSKPARSGYIGVPDASPLDVEFALARCFQWSRSHILTGRRDLTEASENSPPRMGIRCWTSVRSRSIEADARSDSCRAFRRRPGFQTAKAGCRHERLRHRVFCLLFDRGVVRPWKEGRVPLIFHGVDGGDTHTNVDIHDLYDEKPQESIRVTSGGAYLLSVDSVGWIFLSR